MQLKGTTIRVACVQGNPNSFVDVNGQVPVIPRSGRVQMPVSVFLGDPNVAANLETDLSNIAMANIIVRQNSVSGTVIIEKNLPSSAFTAITYDQWTAGADQFVFSLSSTDTNWPAGSIWIALGVTTTDGDDVSLIYCGNASIRDYGIFNPGPPTAPDYTSFSKQESDARYPLVGTVGIVAAITSIGDGAAGSLEAVPTVGMAVPAYRTIDAGDTLQDWKLAASTAASSLDADGKPAVQQPLDYNASTNAKVWFRKR